MSKSTSKTKQNEEILSILEQRIRKNSYGIAELQWEKLAAKLQAKHILTLQQMEVSGGMPNVVHYDAKKDSYTFMDCSPESPAGRRSCCYDQAGLLSRKEHAPATNAMDMAAAMGTQILDEAQYRFLQTLGEFDLKTSSWILTPAPIRQLGGALFGDRRYDHVFVYHNGAQSYYAARGFRAQFMI
ncbi:MAG: DUF4256 domain-containing protein [Chitinophagales bacterium]|nr:DUF4256 domain-containing protein [Chitinophagales bacterium]